MSMDSLRHHTNHHLDCFVTTFLAMTIQVYALIFPSLRADAVGAAIHKMIQPKNGLPRRAQALLAMTIISPAPAF